MDWSSQELEIPVGWKPAWPAKRTVWGPVLSHRVLTSELGVEVRQSVVAPTSATPLQWILWIPAHTDWIEVRCSWLNSVDTEPFSQYIAIPLNVPNCVPTLDIGGVHIQPGRDQIPGTQMDYFTVQNWVDLSSEDDGFGITIATPENPMVQLGGFRFGENAQNFAMAESTVLGWVTCNYWETNFSPIQPGKVTARYRLLPHAGPLLHEDADRFGLDALHHQPLLQQLGEDRRG